METARDTAAVAKCIRCGIAFSCNPTGIGTCWCLERPPKPMPEGSRGCYCPACFDAADRSRKSHTAAL